MASSALSVEPATEASAAAPTISSPPPRYRSLLRWLLLLLPTVLAVLHFGLIATDRYVSEGQFVVRSASRPLSSGTFGALLKMSGLSHASDDVYTVVEYMRSRDALVQLDQKVPLREIYGRPEVDVVSRFPSLIYGDSIDELHQYLARMITPIYNPTTGITTLRVIAFRPDDAKRIADELMRIAENAVNRLNERIGADSRRHALDEVARNQERLIAAQVEITQFRNQELMIDAGSSSILVTELIGKLSAALSNIQTELREAEAANPDTPAIPTLKRRAAALQSQIDAERLKISDVSGGLAVQLARYERLVLQREFAKTTLTASVTALESVDADARRQQLYVLQVVPPYLADHSTEPQSLRMVWTVFSINVVALLVLWLLYSGVKEHTYAT